MSDELNNEDYETLSMLIGSYMSVYHEGGLDEAVDSFHDPDYLDETRQVIQDIENLSKAKPSENSLRQYFQKNGFMYYFVNGSPQTTLFHIKELLTNHLNE